MEAAQRKTGAEEQVTRNGIKPQGRRPKYNLMEKNSVQQIGIEMLHGFLLVLFILIIL